MESSLKWYLYEIFKINNLSREEEKNFSRLGKAGDKWAREEFINSFLKIVPKIAKKYHKYAPEIDIGDMIQEGNIGLIEAFNNFNSTKGRFSAYGALWVCGAIIRAFPKLLYVGVLMCKNKIKKNKDKETKKKFAQHMQYN